MQRHEIKSEKPESNVNWSLKNAVPENNSDSQCPVPQITFNTERPSEDPAVVFVAPGMG
jgi:hypothetical protein